MEDEHRSAGRPTAVAHARPAQAHGMTAKRRFRSPFALLVWWIWAVFAAANLADLAVQGHDRFSLLAAFGLLTVTGVLYAGAWRPQIVADDDGLTISNPLREHQVSWAAVRVIEAGELVRIRCEWPVDGDEGHPAGPQPAGAPGGTTKEAGAPTGKRVIYAWAVHAGRRRERFRQLRKEARGSRTASYAPAQPVPSVAIDPADVAAELSEMAQRTRGAASSEAPVAVAPATRWHWPSIAAIVVPAVALLIVFLL